MAIERCVRAPEHEAAAPVIDPEEVTVAPDTGIVLKIGFQVALVVGIVPETHRHGGHRLGDHQLTDLVHDLLAALVEGVYGAAQGPRLNLAGVHRQNGCAAYESGTNIGSAA